MREKWMRRAVAAVALTAALALAVPAQAAGWSSRAPGSDLFDASWQWIARLWVVSDAGSQPIQHETKRVTGIDPDGLMVNPGEAGDRGSSVDPDG